MPRLNPDQQATTAPAERLLLVLTGTAAAAVRPELDPNSSLRLRKVGVGRWAIEGGGPGPARLRLVSAGASPMSGELLAKLETVPVAGPGASRIPQSWELAGLVVEGRSRLDALALLPGPDGTWAIRSLITTRAPARTDDELLVHAMHGWADRPRVLGDLLVVIDRSASMAWAYRSDGPLVEVLHGISAAAQASLSDTATVQWASYGSGAISDGLAIVTAEAEPRALAEALTPPLFASGSSPHEAFAAAPVGGLVVLVTDRLSPDLLAPFDLAAGVRVVWLGAPSDAALVPAEDQARLGRLRDVGSSVLELPMKLAAGPATVDWLLAELAERPAETGT
jgi:hypothetical protein